MEAEASEHGPCGTRDRLIDLGLRVAIGFCERVGVEGTLRFGAGVGAFWYALRAPRVRRVRDQLGRAFPEWTTTERDAQARAVFRHLGLGLAELALLSGRHRAELLGRMRIDGLHHMEEASRKAGGQGVVLIGPHLGNWEIGAAKLAAEGVPVTAVYRGMRQPTLEAAIRRVREGRAPEAEPGEPIEQIPMGGRAGVRFVRALRRGRHILALLDQHARDDEGLLVPFFGRPAATRIGPLKLADRVEAPVLLAFARRDPDERGHRLEIQPPLQLEPGASDDEDVLRRNLHRITAAFEQEIRASPGQWIWTHRRWRGPADPAGSS